MQLIFIYNSSANHLCPNPICWVLQWWSSGKAMVTGNCRHKPEFGWSWTNNHLPQYPRCPAESWITGQPFLKSKIRKTSHALGWLSTRVLNKYNICISTKLNIYWSVIIPSLLYWSEFWTLIKGTSDNWRNFTCGLCESYSAFFGKTVSPIWKSWIVWSPPALHPWLSELRWDVWDK